MRNLRAFVLPGLVIALLATNRASAQLYGVNPFENTSATPPSSYGLFTLDPDSGAITGGSVITLSGQTVTGVNAVTVDPTTGTVYTILKVSGVSGRVLATLDVATGAATQVGNLGDNFSSLAFRSDGQLFGTTGNGASVPETLYTIDKANASKTVARALGNGADGEVIAYCPDDNRFYHWSGNSTIVFEAIDATAPYDITAIPITGAPGGEVFGAVWDPCRSQFLVHNISSQMDFWTTGGVRSNAQPATSADVRGLALFPLCADRSIVKTLTTPGPYYPGQTVSYSLQVANAGPGPTRSVLVTDTPANLAIASVTGGGCSALPCTIPLLVSGTGVTIDVTATIPAEGPFDNAAAVSDTGREAVTSNNSDDTGNGGAALPSADLSVSKSLSTPPPFSEGQLVAYTILVHNAGPSGATNVLVTDTPTNLSVTGVSGAGCTSLPCTIPSLDAGADATISVMARIVSVGEFDNGAAVSASAYDAVPADNSDAGGNGGTAGGLAGRSIPSAGTPGLLLLGVAVALAGAGLVRRT